MKRLFLLPSILLFVLILLSCGNEEQAEINREYLQIVGTKYNNNIDEGEGVSIVLYEYDIKNKTITSDKELGEVALYPAAYEDYKGGKVYYSGSDNDLYDNLYEFNLETNEKRQLTHGKFLFNDMYFLDDQLFVTAAANGKTVTQPAKFDFEKGEFTYLDEDDDDTWFHSFSYNYSTEKFLCLTTSDKVMRSKRVTEETFIRPKKIFTMDKDFKNKEYIYETEEFEIREARQLDEDNLLMITDPRMGSANKRKLKLLNIRTASIKDISIDQLTEIHSVYPSDDKKEIYIFARDKDLKDGIFSYNIETKKLKNIFEGSEPLEGHRGFVSFIYGMYEK